MQTQYIWSFKKTAGNLIRSSARLLVCFYQLFISPLKPPTCRYSPTCSTYAREVLGSHPLPRALQLIFRRLMSCHPWGGYGYDPPPKRPQTK